MLRSGVVALFVLVVATIGAAFLSLDGHIVLYGTVWTVTGLVAAVGLFLIVRGSRPIAGAGAILAAVAAWLPFFWRTSPSGVVWTCALIAAVALIALGTRVDVDVPFALPILLARFAVGWAFVDNASNDQVWLPAGGGFLTTATQAANRAPLDFVDPPYHAFLAGTVIPHPGTWAGLFLGGEIAFGLLLAVGLFTPIAAWGAMWLSANIILEKSFITHGNFQDKTFFAIELFCLVTAAGRAHGLDASVRQHVPARAAAVLIGTPQGARARMGSATAPQ
jgi:uncharacterized membrane protein YphA (DoxX/SURF4 family)